MKVPTSLMDTINKGNLLDGIDLEKAPKKNPDGTHSIIMTPDQFKKFQENQSKPVMSKPSADQKPSPSQKQAEPKTVGADSGNISVTKDPSASC